MSDKLITLYDIPSTLPQKAWSPNPWKTRYSLNYKGIPYKTVWVEYVDIEKVSKEIGAAPTGTKPDGSPFYTLPCIHDHSTGAVVSESLAIAVYLDKTYPETPVLLPPGSHALQCAFNDAFMKHIASFLSIMLPIAHSSLNPASQDYFRSTREARFGKKLEEFSPPGEIRARHWAEVEKGLGVVDGWMRTNGEGTLYVMGDTLSYADIVVVAFLGKVRTFFGTESQEWVNLLSWHDGRWGRMIDSLCEQQAIR